MSFNIRSTPPDPGVTDSSKAPAPSRRTVLVVDDEDDVRRVTRSYLERSGYQVIEAVNSASAMRAIDNEEADVVVLDLGLAGEDGLDLLRAVRRRSDLPVVVVTAVVRKPTGSSGWNWALMTMSSSHSRFEN